MLMDKRRIHLRSASVRTYTFSTTGFPRFVFNRRLQPRRHLRVRRLGLHCWRRGLLPAPPNHAAQPEDRLRDASRSCHRRTRWQVRRNFALQPPRWLRARVRFQLELDVSMGHRMRAGCSAIAGGPLTSWALRAQPPHPQPGPHGGSHFAPGRQGARTRVQLGLRHRPSGTLRTPAPSPSSTRTRITSSTSGRTLRSPSLRTTPLSFPCQGRPPGWL
jgi:hypothetical protein